MAQQNLLAGYFTGSLGAVTGSKWKDKKVVKLKIISKSPMTQKQIEALNIFGKLQRIIRPIQLQLEGTIHFPHPKATAQNDWVHLSKAAIKDQIFDYTKIIGPRGNLQSIEMSQLFYNKTQNTITGNRNTPINWAELQDKKVTIGFFAGEEIIVGIYILDDLPEQFSFPVVSTYDRDIWGFAMWQSGTHRTKTFSTLKSQIVEIRETAAKKAATKKRKTATKPKKIEI